MACDPWSAASCDVLSACRSRTAASRSRAAASRSPTANPGKLTGLNRGEQLAAQPRTLLPPRGSARGRGGGVRSPARRWEGGFFGPLTGGDPCGGRGHPAQDDLSRPTLRRARMCVVHATARGPSGGEYRWERAGRTGTRPRVLGGMREQVRVDGQRGAGSKRGHCKVLPPQGSQDTGAGMARAWRGL
eukprot:gene22762-biopygen1207